jgi:succinate-semialdehyde dehydrogenase / glutarate-semialdehyde dehydrogenase
MAQSDLEATASRVHQSQYPSVGLFIDGEVMGAGNARLEVVNPATEDVVGTVACATVDDLDRALTAADRGFREWRATPVLSRAAILNEAARLIRERADATARLLTLEQGKPLSHSKMEMLACAETFEWYAAEAGRAYGRIIPPRKAGSRQIVLPEPVGPVAAFTPWNFPALLAARKIAPALAAGCSCILKPSEETPAAAFSLALALRDAKLPAGVLNVVFGVPSMISEHIIPSPIIRKVTLTGSVAAGRAVAALAARGPKPCTLELGGHAPVLVLADADIGFAAKTSALSKTFNAGQVCTSPTRFYVHSSVYEPFLARFSQELEKTRIGDGLVAESRMGPLANSRRMALMSELIEDAVAGGAQVVTGGSRIGNRGYFWKPTVLANVAGTANIMTIEPFGPIATIAPFDELDDGLRRANKSSVGLAGYVFTQSLKAAVDVGDALEVGIVGINSYAVSNTEAPFGGVKDSGYGYEGGVEGLSGYLTQKSISQA